MSVANAIDQSHALLLPGLFAYPIELDCRAFTKRFKTPLDMEPGLFSYHLFTSSQLQLLLLCSTSIIVYLILQKRLPQCATVA